MVTLNRYLWTAIYVWHHTGQSQGYSKALLPFLKLEAFLSEVWHTVIVAALYVMVKRLSRVTVFECLLYFVYLCVMYVCMWIYPSKVGNFFGLKLEK